MHIIISEAKITDAHLIAEFIKEVYDQAVAPNYSDEGDCEFHKYISPAAIEEHMSSNHWILKAETANKLVGIIEIRDNKHLSMLFVSTKHQRKGIGKQLLTAGIQKAKTANPLLQKLSVHSSPNSIDAYGKLGFVAISKEQVVHGIRFTTMEKPV